MDKKIDKAVGQASDNGEAVLVLVEVAVSLTNEHEYQSASKLAKRWGVSEDKASTILESYRGRSGFLDLGYPAERSKREITRKYAIIRIHPALLKEIEADLSKKRVRPERVKRVKRATTKEPDQAA